MTRTCCLRATALLVVLALSPVLAPPLNAQTTRADSAGAVAAVQRFHDALAAGESAGAATLLSADVMIVESGNMQSRLDYPGGHFGVDLKASKNSKGVRTMVKASVVGDVAHVVSHTVTPPTGANGSTDSEMAELMVPSKSSSAWMLRAVPSSSRRRR